MACKRIGHGGASGVVRGNTPASFDAALELGVDMIEFDVRPFRGRLVLGHLAVEPWVRRCVELDAALRHLAQPRFSSVELNVDVKQPGCEAATVEALRRHRLLDRTIVSSQCRPAVRRLREVDRRVRAGISIGGRLSRRVQRWGDWTTGALAGLRAGEFDALMLHHRLVDAALVERAVEAGGEVYAWTVGDRGRIARLVAQGVHGITTDDPRVFSDVGPWAPPAAAGVPA